MPAAKVIPSGIAPNLDTGEEILRKAREIGELLYQRVEASLRNFVEQESYALDRLHVYTPKDRLLNLKEAAAYLKFKPRTIDGWTAPGRPPLIQFVILGGEKRFKKLWLDAAIEAKAVKPRGVVKL